MQGQVGECRDLKGTIRYPAPETDPVNGVTGTVEVHWDLKRSLPRKPGCR
jgi:hypothetical protein